MSSAAKIEKNEASRVRDILQSPFREKLLEMGCTPGTQITKVHQAPFGCPITFDVGGYQLALRRAEAETILVE